jgi:glycosyltransferase involved in cell wall biosynthesis
VGVCRGSLLEVKTRRASSVVSIPPFTGSGKYQVLTDNRTIQSDRLISIIIPAYNEEKSLGTVIRRTRKTLQNLYNPYEIIVVDDGSTDRTSFVANKEDVTVVKNHKNCGKGDALKIGFSYCKGDIIVTMDADGSNQPEELLHLLQPILKNDCDVVIGSRFEGSIEKGAIKTINRIGNRIFNVMIYLLYGRLLTDTQSGFRAFKKKTLANLNLLSVGYEIETEMIIEIIKEKLSISEVPINCTRPEKGISKLRTFHDGWKILKTIFRTYFRRHVRR